MRPPAARPPIAGMTTPSNAELATRWRDEPAPLLPLLHALQERDGHLSDEALRFVAKELRIPIADLFGTVTFYHHFAREAGGRDRPRVCAGPVCALRGAEQIVADLSAAGLHPEAMPCPGRCDEPVPVLRGNRVESGTDGGSLVDNPAPLPPPAQPGVTECVFAGIREPGRGTLSGYRDTGGYRGLERAVQLGRDAVLDLVDASGLAGRGGAGFPTGRKWRAVRDAAGAPKTVVCNADEGEPGCFKDRALMDYDPHALIEGMTIAALATGATRGFIYLRYEYPSTLDVLETAIAEAEDDGLLGDSILDTDLSFRVWVRRGAGAYICGEETSLLNSLEGKHPFPRNRPPFPVTHGFEDLPTAVNNVETIVSVPPILANGADWYAGLGMNGHAGTKVISLSGDIARPGNYEVPIGLPLRTLLDEWAARTPPRPSTPSGTGRCTTVSSDCASPVCRPGCAASTCRSSLRRASGVPREAASSFSTSIRPPECSTAVTRTTPGCTSFPTRSRRPCGTTSPRSRRSRPRVWGSQAATSCGSRAAPKVCPSKFRRSYSPGNMNGPWPSRWATAGKGTDRFSKGRPAVDRGARTTVAEGRDGWQRMRPHRSSPGTVDHLDLRGSRRVRREEDTGDKVTNSHVTQMLRLASTSRQEAGAGRQATRTVTSRR